MKYDFTSILDRNGKDSIAVNPPMEAGWVNFAPVKEGFDLIPMWVADMNFPTVPTIPEYHIDARLRLVDIAGHTCDQRRSPNGIHFRKRQFLNMGKQCIADFGRKPYRRFRRKVLCRNRTCQSNQCKQHHNASHLKNIRLV